MGEIEGMYTCPLCGKTHQNDSLCPVVLDRMKKTKYNTQSFLIMVFFFHLIVLLCTANLAII